MDRFERFYRTFSHEEPDRVPTWETGVDANVLGRVLGRTISSLDDIVRGWIDIVYDMVSVGYSWGKKGSAVRWVDEGSYVNCWGGLYRVGELGRAFLVGGTITPENVDDFSPPEPEDEEVVDSVRRAVKAARGEAPSSAILATYSPCLIACGGSKTFWRTTFGIRLSRIGSVR